MIEVIVVVICPVLIIVVLVSGEIVSVFKSYLVRSFKIAVLVVVVSSGSKCAIVILGEWSWISSVHWSWLSWVWVETSRVALESWFGVRSSSKLFVDHINVIASIVE